MKSLIDEISNRWNLYLTFQSIHNEREQRHGHRLGSAVTRLEEVIYSWFSHWNWIFHYKLLVLYWFVYIKFFSVFAIWCVKWLNAKILKVCTKCFILVKSMAPLGIGRDIFRMKKSKFTGPLDRMRLGLIYNILVWTCSP